MEELFRDLAYLILFFLSNFQILFLYFSLKKFVRREKLFLNKILLGIMIFILCKKGKQKFMLKADVNKHNQQLLNREISSVNKLFLARDQEKARLKVQQLLICQFYLKTYLFKYQKNTRKILKNICQIRDEMIFYQQKVNTQCYSCGETNHTIKDCHFLHYYRSKELIIMRYIYSAPNIYRVPFRRKRKRIKNSLTNLKQTRQNLQKIRLSYIYEALKDNLEKISQKEEPNFFNDKQFFLNCKRFKYVNKQVIVLSDESFSQSDSDDVENSDDQFDDNKQIYSIQEEDFDDSKHVSVLNKKKSVFYQNFITKKIVKYSSSFDQNQLSPSNSYQFTDKYLKEKNQKNKKEEEIEESCELLGNFVIEENQEHQDNYLKQFNLDKKEEYENLSQYKELNKFNMPNIQILINDNNISYADTDKTMRHKQNSINRKFEKKQRGSKLDIEQESIFKKNNRNSVKSLQLINFKNTNTPLSKGDVDNLNISFAKMHNKNLLSLSNSISNVRKGSLLNNKINNNILNTSIISNNVQIENAQQQQIQQQQNNNLQNKQLNEEYLLQRLKELLRQQVHERIQKKYRCFQYIRFAIDKLIRKCYVYLRFRYNERVRVLFQIQQFLKCYQKVKNIQIKIQEKLKNLTKKKLRQIFYNNCLLKITEQQNFKYQQYKRNQQLKNSLKIYIYIYKQNKYIYIYIYIFLLYIFVYINIYFVQFIIKIQIQKVQKIQLICKSISNNCLRF
ncbi:hypothetical protein IMG5_196000 [Ichthyophthirius multifiliis]|uniref:CCHC-type domain-containing protein n=1 Tax=Ichthyophthirius multifiliis TaxID=5932 RepID=G0R516_ICHMU|nr:hypothetical protein IMG5_196000 [Ichthyophthirius multifiliis]EGR27418.1 hypothetical protein IMG5_196000 [Ichthyophthirius multifiliis]|eukprot:XP_004024328.1 hypothetical protein IMG5_196000 [Ichthyophthirius multifiliis]